jgi:CheY-like chemotaxis protein
VSPADRRVIALGNLVGELKTSLETATASAGIELVLTREPAKALVELERASGVAVLVDMATLGAEQFCKRARGTERLRGVPIIGMSRTPSELGFARVFAWGADDLVPLGATPALERRLKALMAADPSEHTSFGQAVVAEGTTQRRALLGRVLVHAGYDVKFAVDRGSVELYASQAETRIVVISATLGDPRKLIESAGRAGGLATWIVTAETRSVARLASSLAGLDRVVVTSTAGSPEDILFLANEIVFGKGNRPREWRALYGTAVAFRPLGATTDDYGFTYDVSPGGLYVRSLLPCESEDVEVELRPPERDERVRLLGKVARRFAFGSGSVASAPPGFGVKVTGPASPALTLWVEACRAHVENVGSGSPPEATTPTDQPPQKKTESASSMPALAVPGPNLTIESVVLPLPSERTDVAELLSETLDEAAMPEAGTRPVTVDADTE